MRCFLGVFPPPDIQRSLRSALDALPERGLRWTTAENLHLTLLFLGEISREEAREVASAMDRMREEEPPFDCRLGTLGSFPPRGRPRVLFVDLLEGADALRRVHRRLLEELPVELRPDRRRLQPHLTVCRPKGRLSSSDRMELAEALSGRRWPFRCEAVDLMRSELGPRGATYHRQHRAPLGGSTPG